MTIGHATTAYTAHYDRAARSDEQLRALRSEPVGRAQGRQQRERLRETAGRPDNLEQDTVMLGSCGCLRPGFADLNDYQKEKLEDAYDKSMCGANDNSDDENKLLYGGYEPIIVTITHILNERQHRLDLLLAHGRSRPRLRTRMGRQYQLAGFYDNTDIAKRLANIMRLPEMPVTKHVRNVTTA
jgi:alkaline phosphatase